MAAVCSFPSLEKGGLSALVSQSETSLGRKGGFSLSRARDSELEPSLTLPFQGRGLAVRLAAACEFRRRFPCPQ